MFSYFSRKLSTLFFSLFFITTLTFFLVRAIPGNPFLHQDGLPEEVIASLNAFFGLDQPLFIQYIHFLKKCFTFDFGHSLIYQGKSTFEIIKTAFPYSAILGGQALCLSLILGVGMGVFSALKQNSWIDQLCLLGTTIAISLPVFILAPLLQYIFSIKLNFLPIALWGDFSHTILPTIAIACFPTVLIIRLTRSHILSLLDKNYILVAKAKGLSSLKVFKHHLLKNTLLPVFSYLGPALMSLLTGSFVVEKVFSIPGLGQWMILSVGNCDYPVIMGLTIFTSSVLLISIFIIDMIYGYLDPRIQCFNPL